ncbi:MAG: superoxide dismutase family protein [Micromonosporaceae bacterium]
MLSKVLIGAVATGVAAVATPAVVMAATGGHQASRNAAMPTGAAMPAGAATRGGDDHGRVHVILRNAQGDEIGDVNLTADHGATLVSVRASGLTPGFHGFHIHSAGVCDAGGTAPFASAGGHFNPTGTAEGMQAGAFPLLLAGQDGRATASFVDANIRLNQLFGPSGTSIVVHSMPDNYANIPARYTSGGAPGPDMETQMTGDDGTRVACGVITAPIASPSGSPSPSPTTPMQAPSQMPTMPAPVTSQPMPTTSPTTPQTTPSPAPTPADTASTAAPTPTPVPTPVPTHF